MFERPRRWQLALIAALLAGCQLPTVKRAAGDAAASESIIRSTGIAARVGKAAIPAEAAEVAADGASIVAEPVAPTAQTPLVGDKGAGLVGNNGSGVISDKGGTIIANNGSALSGVVRVPIGLLANNGAGYRVTALATEAAPQAEVALVDDQDRLLPGTAWTRCDAQGRYAFAQVPEDGNFFVLARVAAGGKQHQLRALARLAAEEGTVVDVGPASALVAEKTRLVAAEQDQPVDAFEPGRVRQLEAAAQQALAGAQLPDFSQPSTAIASALDRLIQADAEVAAQARAIDKNVGTPMVRVSKQLAGGIFSPEHVACDREGNLFIAGLNDHKVWKLPAGSTTPQVFAEGGGIKWPHGIAVDAQGNVYVGRRIDSKTASGDIPGKQVFKISPDGKTITALAHAFEDPWGMCLSPDGRTLYVVNRANGGSLVAYALGTDQGKVVARDLPNPNGIAADSKGLLYITHRRYEGTHADAALNGWRGAIATYDPRSGTKSLFYLGVKTVTGADALEGIAIDAADNLYVTNNWGNTIFKFTPKQKKIETFLKFNQPTGIAFDRQGNLVVADYIQGTLSLVTP